MSDLSDKVRENAGIQLAKIRIPAILFFKKDN